MKALLAVLAIVFLSGCQGFMGLDYDSRHYTVESQHTVRGQYLAGVAQGDGKYAIVIGKRDSELRAWVERDGEYLNSVFEVRRLLPNPWWPFPYRDAVKRGTPKELGLYDGDGIKCDHRLLLPVSPRHRVVSRYAALVARYGKEAVTVATNDRWNGTPRYWLEVEVDGKRFAEPISGTYRYHYTASHPKQREDLPTVAAWYHKRFVLKQGPTKWVEQWRGSLDEMEDL